MFRKQRYPLTYFDFQFWYKIVTHLAVQQFSTMVETWWWPCAVETCCEQRSKVTLTSCISDRCILLYKINGWETWKIRLPYRILVGITEGKKPRSRRRHRWEKIKTYVFFFNLHSGGWSPNWVHSARLPLTGLMYLPRVIVRMENLVEWMAGETKVLGENLPRHHFVHHKSHLTRPGIESGPPRWEASD
jgi:hypothetical protein